MIRTMPQKHGNILMFRVYVIAFYGFLFAPLIVTAVLAFNDSQFPALPWQGFTFEWFTGDSPDRVGFFHDRILLDSLIISLEVATIVAVFAVLFGTMTAFLFEQEDFTFKNWLYLLMLSPLVVPGVILGISILSFSIDLGQFIEDR